MKHAVLLVLVYMCIYAEHCFESTMALSMEECDLYQQQLGEKVNFLEAERNNLHQRLLEANEVIGNLKMDLMQAKWEVRELSSSLKREEKTVLNVQRELSNSQRRVEQLRDQNDEAKQIIDKLEYKIKYDPRNDCKCLCSQFDVARFCIARVYWLVTYFVRSIPFSNLILGTLDSLVEWIEPEVHLIETTQPTMKLLW